jgi:hypothetical protein
MNLFESAVSDDRLFARLRDDQRFAQNRELINALYNDQFRPPALSSYKSADAGPGLLAETLVAMFEGT